MIGSGASAAARSLLPAFSKFTVTMTFPPVPRIAVTTPSPKRACRTRTPTANPEVSLRGCCGAETPALPNLEAGCGALPDPAPNVRNPSSRYR